MKPNYTATPFDLRIPDSLEKLTLFPDGWGEKGKAAGQARFVSQPIQVESFTVFITVYDNETPKKLGQSLSFNEMVEKRVQEELAKAGVKAVPPTVRKAESK